MWLYSLSLSFLLVISSREVTCISVPNFIETSRIDFTESLAISFPDDGRTGDCPFPVNFIGPMYFLSDQSGNFLVGSGDVLFMMNETSLACVANYTWPTNSDFSAACSRFDEICLNFIRVYERFPSDSSRLLVCGTQSGIAPQCRTLQITADSFVSDSATAPVHASANLISNFHDVNSIGGFLQRAAPTSMDPIYVSGAYYESIDRRGRFGTDFNITYHTVSFDDGELNTTASLRMLKSTLWFAHPASFIGVHQANFVVNNDNIEYLFLFVREGSLDVSSEVVNSRVVRICKNDPGVDGHFTTYIKSGIYCLNQRPDMRSFAGDDDYRYTEITSMVFNGDGSRYSEDISSMRLMYGAFSGPRLGPGGTAICVYRADYGVNRGIVGVFNDNLIRDTSNGPPDVVRNLFFDCPEGGRTDPEDFTFIRTSDDISQIGQVPLMILDGLSITQMALDNLCMVRKESNTTCRNQDVLFVGTDLGKILKIVFANRAPFETEPIVSEEILLGDSAAINNMAVRMDANGGKFLLVNTESKIHRFPLERCSRLIGCRACIGARDPYCAWDNQRRLCVKSNFSEGRMVEPEMWQNVHTGSVEGCNAQVDCVVEAIAVNHQTIMCSAACNSTNEINISTSLLPSTSVNCQDVASSIATVKDCKMFESPEGLGLHSYDCITTSLSPPTSPAFVASVQTRPGPPVAFRDFSSCSDTLCTICVQVMTLTDFFSNYLYQVHYGSASPTPLKELSEDGGCVDIRGLTPGTTLNYIVEVQNSVSSINSTLKTADLLEAPPGPVGSLAVNEPSNTSLRLSWSPPELPNGVISGYSVYVNDTIEIGCAHQFTATDRVIDNLLPFTYYSFAVSACNGAGEGTVSAEVVQKTLCGTPSSVVNVAISNIAPDGMTFQWDSPVHSNGDDIKYQVMMEIYGTINGVIPRQVNVTSTLHRLEMITPETLCCADISAIASCGLEHFGPPVRICDETLAQDPGVVFSLMVPSYTIGIRSFGVSWEPPPNLRAVRGVVYDVEITNRPTSRLTDATFLHVGDLNPCTLYTVRVTATMGGRRGPSDQIEVTTKSSLPPPKNVSFFVNTNGMLAVSWLRPSDLDCGIQTSYQLSFRCNQFVGEMEISSGSLSASIGISEESQGIGWCVARMQSCDDSRCGNFSSEATVSLFRSPPSQPQCVVQPQSSSTNVSVSFVLTQPFVTNSTRIEWNLTSTNPIRSGSYPYTASDGNIIQLDVDSNSNYDFSLRTCDIYGCGNPCMVTFTTADNPEPPRDIMVSKIANTSARITWRSTPGQVYSISLASSCPNGNYLMDGLTGMSYTVDSLCPHNNYTFAIRATDSQTNKSSVYSEVFDFSTPAGIPTNPRRVVGVYDQDRKELFVAWIIPVELNGIIDKYEVRWSEAMNTCDQLTTFQNTTAFEYSIPTGNIESYYVCVRAITTERTVGTWGNTQNINVKSAGLMAVSEDCDTLTAVASVAAFTVASSLIMSVVLSVSIIQKGWFCFKNEVHGEKN